MTSKYLTTSALLLSAIAVSSLNATVFTLDNAAVGSYLNGTETVVSAISFAGATFDISYTLDATADGTNPFVSAAAAGYGIGSDTAADSDATIDGQYGDGIAFLNLSLSNFNAGTSGLVEGDISFSFDSFIGHNDGNGNDGVVVSYSGYDTAPTSGIVAIGSGGTDQTWDLTGLANYSSTATSLYLMTSSTNSKNRWGVAGVNINVIPEPSSYALLAGLLGVSFVMLRRRQS